MDKQTQLTFCKADFVQYNYVLSDEEIQEKIASFLLKYVSIEAFYKKLLIIEKEQNGRKLTQKEKRDLNVRTVDVKRVLKYFGISVDEELVERIFGSNDKSYMDCSIKKLRDRLVHNVNDNVLRCILERYDGIETDLNAFLNLFSGLTK